MTATAGHAAPVMVGQLSCTATVLPFDCTAPLPCPDLTCCPALQAALGIRFRHINVRQQYNVLGLGFEVGVQEKAVVSD